MPIYEYACQQCGHTLDALQKVADGPLKKCPECGALKLKRLVSAPQFRLKGSGWYETDFKKDKQKRLADKGDDKPSVDKADKPDGKDAKDGKDGKDTKPAAAEAPKDKPASVAKPEKAAKKRGKSSSSSTAAD